MVGPVLPIEAVPTDLPFSALPDKAWFDAPSLAELFDAHPDTVRRMLRPLPHLPFPPRVRGARVSRRYARYIVAGVMLYYMYERYFPKIGDKLALIRVLGLPILPPMEVQAELVESRSLALVRQGSVR